MLETLTRYTVIGFITTTANMLTNLATSTTLRYELCTSFVKTTEWTRVRLNDVEVVFIKVLIWTFGSMPCNVTLHCQLFEVQNHQDVMDLSKEIAKYDLSWCEIGNSTPLRSEPRNVRHFHIKIGGRRFRGSRWPCEVQSGNTNCYVRYC